MTLPNDEQTRLYESYWHPMERMFGQDHYKKINEFFWNWLWSKVPNRKPRKNEVYNEFKIYLNRTSRTKSEEILSDLLISADHYTRIFCDREADVELAIAFKSFNKLNVNTARLLLMELYTQYKNNNNLSKKEFIYLVKILKSFLFRRSVCGRLITGLNHYFTGLAKQLETVEIVECIIGNLLAQDINITAFFPSDEYFEEQFTSRDCYNRFGSKCSYYLEAIENYHRPKEPISAKKYQIEHVLPQNIANSPEWQKSLGKDWKHLHEPLCNSLGNLTLTGYNQEYSNKSFEFKLNKPDDGFARSPLYLNRLTAKETEWNADSINRRSAKLMEDAKKIWPYPTMSESILAKYKPQKIAKGRLVN